MTTKRCFKCLCEKPLELFYKHSRMADGHLNKCKDCTKKDVAEHRQSNLENVRQYDRMRASMPHRVALRREIGERWRNEHPDRKIAHMKVKRAITAGKIQRLPCFVCGDQKVEAHHPDYSRPLDVVWLCVPHHRQTHAMVKTF